MASLEYDAEVVLTLRRSWSSELLDAEVSVYAIDLSAAGLGERTAASEFMASRKPLVRRNGYGHEVEAGRGQVEDGFLVGQCFFKICKVEPSVGADQLKGLAKAAFEEFNASSYSAMEAIENLAEVQKADLITQVFVSDGARHSRIAVLDNSYLHQDFSPADIIWAAQSALLPLTDTKSGMVVIGGVANGAEDTSFEVGLSSHMKSFRKDAPEWRMKMRPSPDMDKDGFWFLTGIADASYLGENVEPEVMISAVTA